MRKKDDWEKPRSNGTHLSADEIAFIGEGYRASRPTRDVARDLKCSTRIVSKYYGLLVAQGTPRRPTRRKNISLAPMRFYRSDFEPT